MASLSLRSCAWLFAIALAVLGIEVTAAAPVCAACGDYVRIGSGHSPGPVGQMARQPGSDSRDNRLDEPRLPQKCDSPVCRGESPAPVSPAPAVPVQTAEDWACLNPDASLQDAKTGAFSLESADHDIESYSARIERPPRDNS